MNSKLNEDQVREICARLVAGESTIKIAKAFGVVPGTIQSIKDGNTWKHIDALRSNVNHQGTLRGQYHGHAKFTNADIDTIRQRVNAGETCSSIAREYGVHQSTISRIANGQRWGHIPDP